MAPRLINGKPTKKNHHQYRGKKRPRNLVLPSEVDDSKLSKPRKPPLVLTIDEFSLEAHIAACSAKPGWTSDKKQPKITQAYAEGWEIKKCLKKQGAEAAKKMLSDLGYRVQMM
jgi:hypothetical protein